MAEIIFDYLTIIGVNVLSWGVALRIMFDLFNSIVFDKRF